MSHAWHMAGALMVTKQVSACSAAGVALVLAHSRCSLNGLLTLQVGDPNSGVAEERTIRLRFVH